MEFVSIYAAAVATVVALVQILTWMRGRTRIRLRVNPGTAPVQAGSDGGGGTLSKDGEVIFIRVVNRSDHPVRLSTIGGYELRQLLSRLKGKAMSSFVVVQPYPQHLPIEIDARDSKLLWINRENVRSDRRMIFTASTTAGDVFKTRPLRLSRRPAMGIARTTG